MKHGWQKDRPEDIFTQLKKVEDFYNLVKTGAEYDLKSRPEWKSPQYMYNGEVVDNDTPGNINFGYLGRVFGYPEPMLTKGAGVYQILTDIKAGKHPADIARGLSWDSFGDDPRDTATIRQGIARYERLHPQVGGLAAALLQYELAKARGDTGGD